MLLARWRRRNTDDGGFALLTVVMSMFVLTSIVAAALTYAVQTQVGSRRAQDNNGALTAARAGVDDLLARLNKEEGYLKRYPGASQNDPADFDCTNTAWMRAGMTGSPCGWGAGTPEGWITVPGSTGAQFHYDLTVPTQWATSATTTVVVTSTGKVRGVTRSAQANLRLDGFTGYGYVSEFETPDPGDVAVYGANNAVAQSSCPKYHWAGRPVATVALPVPSAWFTPDSRLYCADVPFVNSDLWYIQTYGKIHSNDTMVFRGGGNFAYSDYSTSSPACPPTCYRNAGGPNPTFGSMSHKPAITLPTSTSGLRKNVDPAGCLYSGPTRIKLSGDGTMRVWSKWTKGPLNPGCGTPTAAGLWAPGGQSLPVPDNNIVYVQDVPAGQTGPAPNFGVCPTYGISNDLPIANDFNFLLPESLCNKGNLYIEGAMRGRVTFAVDNDIILTGHVQTQGFLDIPGSRCPGATVCPGSYWDVAYFIAYGWHGPDRIGLVATNSVKVYHPVQCTAGDAAQGCTAATELSPQPVLESVYGEGKPHLRVTGAVLAINHSISVQSYQFGPGYKGTLGISGSTAQRFHGQTMTYKPDWTWRSGYAKGLSYDAALDRSPPPFFPTPAGAPWVIKTYGEIKVPTEYA